MLGVLSSLGEDDIMEDEFGKSIQEKGQVGEEWNQEPS